MGEKTKSKKGNADVFVSQMPWPSKPGHSLISFPVPHSHEVYLFS